jgi:hypothetical protein
MYCHIGRGITWVDITIGVMAVIVTMRAMTEIDAVEMMITRMTTVMTTETGPFPTRSS